MKADTAGGGGGGFKMLVASTDKVKEPLCPAFTSNSRSYRV